MSTSTARAAASHQRRQERGWRKLQTALPPEAATALKALERATGRKPTPILAELLIAAARQLSGSGDA